MTGPHLPCALSRAERERNGDFHAGSIVQVHSSRFKRITLFLSRYDSTPQKGDSKSQKAQLGLALQQRFRKESQRGPEVVAENDDWEWMREQKTVGTNARDRGGALYIAQLYYKASRLTTIAITKQNQLT